MKIVNFKKFLKSISLILLFIGIFSILFAQDTFSHKETEYVSIYVCSGDTLWSIAEELQKNNEYYENMDIRDIIYDIKNINNLESSNIYENQELMIPII